MKLILILLVLLCPIMLKTQSFNEYFTQNSLRIEYVMVGNHNSQEVFLSSLKKNNNWAGPINNLFNNFNYGHYQISAYDSVSNKLIFSKGYSSLFREWQDTPEAKQKKLAYPEVQLIPFPKKTIRLEIERRDKQNVFQPLFSIYINPETEYIINEKPPYNFFEIQKNGEPSQSVDIVFIPDGYTKDEMQKFKNDAKRFTQYLFNSSPLKENINYFNVYGIEAISLESGPDLPGKDIWKNTAFNSAFYTFNMERYLNTFDIWALYDAASAVPADIIFVIVNSDKYGGSGIYNYYAVCSSDNILAEYVTVHEFGHAFGGLADEYYEKTVTYTDYYPLNIEPWEPNITTLVDFANKWKNMLAPNTPIPTPEIDKDKYKVGVFEGGGYTNKGVYRPRFDCTMKSNPSNNFCPVCKSALQKKIDFYRDIQ